MAEQAIQRSGVLQPALAGALAAVVGFASTFTIVLAGLTAVGASPAQAGSGLLAATLAVGGLNVLLSWRSRMPISVAWSTPGAALLLTAGLQPGGFAAATGAFIAAGLLIAMAGLFRPVARAVAAIPAPIASAMLAGVLVDLCLAPLRAVQTMPASALPIILAWALALRFARRYAVPVAVLVTIVVLVLTVQLPAGAFDAALPMLSFVTPAFRPETMITIALPLFIVTMASQNLPGIAVMQANGYRFDTGRVFVGTGLASIGAALFGGHPVNLAAITAALCAGPEAHPDPARRWIAPVAAGCVYLLLALGANFAAAFVSVSPPLLIQAVAGLALLPSLAGALAAAVGDEGLRLPAIATFVTTASGLTVFGIGGAFWGLVAGLGLTLLLAPGVLRNRA
ncbi:MAG: Benzoate transport protein [Devosia sp.]|nr:Benzoate transport protein [Devosia sp.]